MLPPLNGGVFYCGLTNPSHGDIVISMSAPKRYKALHILPGLVNYTENDQETTVRVTKEALERMNPSFVGKPVFNFVHKIIDAETAFNFTDEEKDKLAVGVITDVGYDEESGYFTVHMMIWDEETQQNIDENGFTVSCAYIPTETGPGGTHNKVPYDEEVIDGEYHHMAIVENPRYEGVRIFVNSEGEKTVKKFKLFTKKPIRQNADPEPPKDPKENAEDEGAMDLSADAYIVDEEGNKIPVAEMVENYKAMQNEIPDEEEEDAAIMNMDDTVEIDGKEVPMKELYENYCSKKNAEPPTDTPLEESVKENGMKENSVPNNETPNQHFRVVQNAASQGGQAERIKPETSRSRIARGAARYGSKVTQGV